MRYKQSSSEKRTISPATVLKAGLSQEVPILETDPRSFRPTPTSEELILHSAVKVTFNGNSITLLRYRKEREKDPKQPRDPNSSRYVERGQTEAALYTDHLKKIGLTYDRLHPTAAEENMPPFIKRAMLKINDCRTQVNETRALLETFGSSSSREDDQLTGYQDMLDAALTDLIAEARWLLIKLDR